MRKIEFFQISDVLVAQIDIKAGESIVDILFFGDADDRCGNTFLDRKSVV